MLNEKGIGDKVNKDVWMFVLDSKKKICVFVFRN